MMANAMRCDRCGKFFDPFDMDGVMMRFKNPVFKTQEDFKDGTNDGYFLEDESADAVVDLCPSCTLDFDLFMTNFLPKERPKDSKVNEKPPVIKLEEEQEKHPEPKSSGVADYVINAIDKLIKDIFSPIKKEEKSDEPKGKDSVDPVDSVGDSDSGRYMHDGR